MPNNMNINQGGADRCRRIIGLDILRISLVVLIYLFHSWMHFKCNYSIFTDFVSVGAIAMTGFFMVSGYSLRLVYGGQNLMDKHNLGRFYIKRMLGILPLYYFVALLYIALIGRKYIIDNLFLFPIEVLGLQSTFTSLSELTHNAGTWFVSCLLLAYLIYPFLQTICKSLSWKYKVMLLLLFVFIDLWAYAVSNRFQTAMLYENPFYRILEFSCGLIIADINLSYEHNWLKVLRSKWILFFSIILLLVGVSFMRCYFLSDDYMLYNYIALPCFIIMLFAFGNMTVVNPRVEKTLGYISAISYGFFLSQFFAWKVGKWTLYFLGYDNNWLRIIIPLIFCICASIFMYECIQKPIVRFVNRKILI